jgi:hypothetical protein
LSAAHPARQAAELCAARRLDESCRKQGLERRFGQDHGRRIVRRQERHIEDPGAHEHQEDNVRTDHRQCIAFGERVHAADEEPSAGEHPGAHGAEEHQRHVEAHEEASRSLTYEAIARRIEPCLHAIHRSRAVRHPSHHIDAPIALT